MQNISSEYDISGGQKDFFKNLKKQMNFQKR